MTPEQWAENIAYTVNGDSLYNDDRPRFRTMYSLPIALVTAQIEVAIKESRAAAFEEAAKIAREVEEGEIQRRRLSNIKGDIAVFQSQSYIDGAVEVEERICAKAKVLQ